MPQLKEGVAAIWETGMYGQSLTVVISLIVAGLSIKSGLFPFHIWVADAHGSTVSSSSGILSGVVFKGYIVLLVKLIFCVFGTEVFYACGAANVLFVYGVLGMLFGSLSAIQERHFKRMVAYSSVAQIGYIYMGLGISPALGVGAACFHILAHACAKPALFLSCERLADASGGMDMERIRGAGRKNPAAGICFTVAALSLVGIPGLMGFVSKLLLAGAGVDAAGWRMLPTLLALAVSAGLNAVYLMRTVILLYAPMPETLDPLRWRGQKSIANPAACFTGANLLFGFFSQPVVDAINAGLALL
jgi:multicomponent Na+:H+ antiporter subunit D